jgi:hypothetical protein
MKQLAIILLLLSSGILHSFGQTETLGISNDQSLVRIQENLPNDWEMLVNGNSIAITKRVNMHGIIIDKEVIGDTGEEVHQHENAYQGPSDTLELTRISFKLSNAMPIDVWDSRMAGVRSNEKINQKIKNLPDKMNIGRRDGKGKNTMLDFKSEEEELAYDAEMDRLHGQIQEIPRYHSDNYCFTDVYQGQLLSTHQWSPKEIVAEIELIQQLLDTHLKTE